MAAALAIGSAALAQQPQAQQASAPAAAAEKKSAPKRVAQGGSGHVYLLRGLLNIFSLGMDDLAAKVQARGISASVHNHSEWQSLADDIAARYKAGRHGPIVLVGHSLGADAVMFMAEYLGKKGVPVALVIPFDGTGSFAASSNVQQVVNFTQRDYAHMRRGAGFRGQLSNVDVSGQAGIDHINIDKSARLHALALGKIQSVVGGRRSAGDGATPRPRPAAEPTATGSTPAAAPAAPAAPESAPAPKPATGSSAATSGVSSERTAEAARAPAKPDAAPAKPDLRF